MRITKVLDKGKLETILGLLATAVSFTRTLTFRFFSFCRISNMSVFRVLNWVPLETLHLLMGQTITSFSNSLKQTPIDVTTWGSFLIASFKILHHCVVIGWMEPWPQFSLLFESTLCLLERICYTLSKPCLHYRRFCQRGSHLFHFFPGCM